MQNGGGSTSAVAAAAAATTAPRRLKYRRPWLIFFPTAVAFVLLNYLVATTETDETGAWRILPDYVSEAATERSVAQRDGTEVPVNYFLDFEQVVMGTLFRVGRRCFGSLQGIQLVWAIACIIHMYELGICVRICRECRASKLVMLRYCFCVSMAGIAQLMPLRKARDEYLQAVQADEARAKLTVPSDATSEKKKN